MLTEIAIAVTTKATVSHVRQVIGEVLAVYLFSIGKGFPPKIEWTADLFDYLQIKPSGHEMKMLCNRLSEVFFCEQPTFKTRKQWITLMDLYLFYLSRARTEREELG
jgi:hypothetical protein